jgi:hypothetical protein
MLLLCTSVTGAGMSTTNLWYPNAVAEADDATASAAMPRIVIAEESYTRQRYAEGARGIPQGSLTLVLQADVDAGTIEVLARSICDDLEYLSQSAGLANVRASTSLAAEPESAQIAADDTTGYTAAKFSSINIQVEYGLNA